MRLPDCGHPDEDSCTPTDEIGQETGTFQSQDETDRLPYRAHPPTTVRDVSTEGGSLFT